jgi:hypothetical protein
MGYQRQRSKDRAGHYDVAAFQHEHGGRLVGSEVEVPERAALVCSSQARRASAADRSGVNWASATPGMGRSMARISI